MRFSFVFAHAVRRVIVEAECSAIGSCREPHAQRSRTCIKLLVEVLEILKPRFGLGDFLLLLLLGLELPALPYRTVPGGTQQRELMLEHRIPIAPFLSCHGFSLK